jgi:hypothetical protein
MFCRIDETLSLEGFRGIVVVTGYCLSKLENGLIMKFGTPTFAKAKLGGPLQSFSESIPAQQHNLA